MSDTGKPTGPKEERLSKAQYQQIQDMPVSEKIKLAATGGREVRTILIKDGNKEVQAAVLESARITEIEVVAIARSRKTGDELLRKIALNRDWLKNYKVRVALTNNPKTPLPISLRLLATLLDADLKRLTKSEEVAQELIVAAERAMAERASAKRAPGKPLTPKDEKPKSRLQEIKDLPVPEKIKLAMVGDKEARSILMKDSNKQVVEAVLDSPKIAEQEIVTIANSRSVADELLRKIATRREWMKNYQIRLALANNPKTPLPIGLKIVGTLMISDLKRLSKNKGVSSVITTAAQRFLTKKGHN